MAKKSKAVAARGSVNNIILESLLSGAKYGYEIIKEVEKKTNNKVSLKQPSLYSSLKRFEAKNYITSYWGDSDIGGRRHYYEITPLGRKYFNKGADEDVDIVEKEKPSKKSLQVTQKEEANMELQNIEEFEIDGEDDGDASIQASFKSFNVDEKINSLLSDNNSTSNKQNDDEEIIEQLYDAVDKNDEIEDNMIQLDKQEEIIPDHEFYKPTPLTQEDVEKRKNGLDKLYGEKSESSQSKQIDSIASENSELIDNNEKQYNNEEKVTEKKKPKIYTDELGITKIYYDEPITKQKTYKPIDNVVARSNIKADTYYDFKPASIKKHELFNELSEEEKMERNQKFLQKFESITREKTNQSVEPEKEFSNKYKNILGELYSPEPINESKQIDREELEQTIVAENERPVGKFNSNISLSKYSKDLQKEGYNVKVYSQQKEKEYKNKYLLVNKAKFIFGLTMLVIMLLQVTLTLIILKNNNLLYEDHYWIYKLAFVIIGIITLLFCVPVFISPNKQASSTFNLGYGLMFGALGFFVTLILTYAINTFMGLEYTNIAHFSSTLLIPTVLSSNFIFGPAVYKVITLFKKLY